MFQVHLFGRKSVISFSGSSSSSAVTISSTTIPAIIFEAALTYF
jgi:hypothetical protein